MKEVDFLKTLVEETNSNNMVWSKYDEEYMIGRCVEYRSIYNDIEYKLFVNSGYLGKISLSYRTGWGLTPFDLILESRTKLRDLQKSVVNQVFYNTNDTIAEFFNDFNNNYTN